MLTFLSALALVFKILTHGDIDDNEKQEVWTALFLAAILIDGLYYAAKLIGFILGVIR